MKTNIQVKYINSQLAIFLNGDNITPDDPALRDSLLSDSGFSVDINIDEAGEAEEVTIAPELNIKKLGRSMPYKGEGFIKIHDENDIERAYEVLKEYVGEDEFEYCPSDFIKAGKSSLTTYYGKFEIEDLEGLYQKMADNGIIVIKADFIDQLDL